MNLEIKTEKLTHSVVDICETVCSQHEICIQMLKGKEYQTLYKVMKKEQKIKKIADIIEHQIVEMTPMMNLTSAGLRRLNVSSHITFELLYIKDNPRTVASFANHCDDEQARGYAKEMEERLVDSLRKAALAYQNKSLAELNRIGNDIVDVSDLLCRFHDEIEPSEQKQSLMESMDLTLQCVRKICAQIHYLYTGEKSFDITCTAKS